MNFKEICNDTFRLIEQINEIEMTEKQLLQLMWQDSELKLCWKLHDKINRQYEKVSKAEKTIDITYNKLFKDLKKLL